ncbi:hypothetical protein KFE25_007467 [Diacronema lutheri]|uniref:Transmembrane protein n=1 Tax=Diacronema lutheri TaxID=2081491 RepID=A0A8J5XZZ7_DIALT|nr:hypothetical protein KFE25_007467 [Diacronema lutheri]
MGLCASGPQDARPLVSADPPSDAPLKRQATVRRNMGVCGGCFRYISNAWAFDNFDMDLEGGDWRYAFATSRAMRSHTTLLLLRIGLCALMAVYFAFVLAQYAPGPLGGLRFWAIHFSSWVDSCVLVYLVASVGVHVRALLLAGTPEPRSPALTPWYVSFLWFLYAIALPMSIVSMALELVPSFGGLGRTAPFMDAREPPVVLMLVSMFLNNFSYHVFLAIWPMLFALAYIAFTLCYYRLSGADEDGALYIFAKLDWASPGSATGVTGATFAIGGALLSLCWCACSALVRSVSDTEAWKRIEAAHAMLVLPGARNHMRQGGVH